MEKLAAGAKRIGLDLTTQQLEQFQVYYGELVDWNRRINLTSIVGYEEVQIKHFLDSLTVTLVLPDIRPPSRLQLLDLGAGAGLPGVPLKIIHPEIELVLLDSVAKKSAFLQHLVGRLGLEGVAVVTARAEELARQPSYRERFDVVASRAVARMPTLAELGLPLCRVGGVLITQKKGAVTKEIEKAAPAIEALGGRLREVKRLDLEELEEERLLVVIEKVSPTPQSYPRRPGLPSHRPLLSPAKAADEKA
jgi:16S rRNA (guanine527-N7)-methyltransferase